MMALMKIGRDAMTTAMHILKKLGRNRRADPVRLDDRIFRDIGLSRMTVEFAAIR
jgi:uncharacterized protein YjiS (DUF1127 family)